MFTEIGHPGQVEISVCADDHLSHSDSREADERREGDRLKTLTAYGILDTEPEPAFDRVAKLAARTLGVPIVLISFIDEQRQWFKARVGVPATEVPREDSFCTHVVRTGTPLVVPDAREDARFRDKPHVAGPPGVRFYAGVPILADGHALGSLCVLDVQPRQISDKELETLRDLAAILSDELELRAAYVSAAAMEQSLRESEARMRRTCEASLDAVVGIDGTGRIYLWNAAATQLFGWSEEETMGKTVSELVVPPRLRDEHDARLMWSLTQGETPERRMETYARRRDGSEFPVELTLASFKVGDAVHHATYVRDLTEHRRIETALRASEERFQRIVANIPGVVFCFRFTPEGDFGFSFVSDGVVDLCGYTADQIVGGEVDILAAVHPEDRARFQQSIRESAENVSPWRWEGRVFCANGAMRWIEAGSRPRFVAPGEVEWDGVVIDATARKQTEEALRKTAARLNALVETTPNAIYVKDMAGRYELVNRRFVELTNPAGDVVGRRDDEVFEADLCNALRVGEEEALFAGGIVQSEEEILANGEPRTLLWVRDVLHDADGHPIGVLGTATDITARKTAERMIREVNQRLEERVRQRTEALQKAQAEMLTRLGRAAEYRDDATGEHIGRMSLTCGLIARAAGLRPAQCEMIALASQMHDIGKIGIPDCILLKPGPLTEDELTVMRTHTVIGAGLLSGGTTPLIQLAEAIARDHHERWDGTGYPRGLIGEQIPLAARITAIADVFDALTSERPYKRAWSVEEAAEEILRQSGRMFDPRLVAAFLSVLDRVPLAAPEPGFRRAG